MIVNKIRRRVTARVPGRAEHAYMTRLSRYIVRADIEDLRKLALHSDDQYLRDLARYAVAEGRQEAALASGSMNLLGNNVQDWQAEMAALLHRCHDPVGAIDHWVFSWQAGEEPSVDEVQRSLQIFMSVQGLSRCPAVWGYHEDTDNRHVHLQVLRIDRVTGARTTAGGGWDIDTAHRAKAIIEGEFPHWGREAGSLYEVCGGILVQRSTNMPIGPASKPASWEKRGRHSHDNQMRPSPDSKAIDPQSIAYEEATGFMSRKRIAMEVAVPIVLNAVDLDTAHRLLAAEGIELRRERTGANFIIDSKPVKASIDRRTSLANLESQFKQNLTASPYLAEPCGQRERWPNDTDRQDYYRARRAHDALLVAAWNDVSAAFPARGRDDALSAAITTAASAAAFPGFDDWKNGGVVPNPGDAIATALGLVVLKVDVIGQQPNQSLPVVGFKGVRLGNRTVYRAYGERGGYPAFIDVGDRVVVHAATDRAAVRASLLLIAGRYPDNNVKVTGSKRFQELVVEIANAEGVRLEGALGRKQQRLRVPEPSARKQPVRIYDGRESSAIKAPDRAVPMTGRRSRRDRLLSMVARLFHDVDPFDRTGISESPLTMLRYNIPTAVRTSPEVAVHHVISGGRAQIPAGEQARRAAAMAAAAHQR